MNAAEQLRNAPPTHGQTVATAVILVAVVLFAVVFFSVLLVARRRDQAELERRAAA
jgi:hypothetical protein